jgi:hypothetical protein
MLFSLRQIFHFLAGDGAARSRITLAKPGPRYNVSPVPDPDSEMYKLIIFFKK